MVQFAVDPDIRKARTLATRFYTDPRYFDLAKKKIFERGWHFLGRPGPADGLMPVTILPGLLDEPVMLATHGGSTICLSNVCTHRGKILVEEPCSPRLIRCRYHGRRFSLDGQFLSMPEFDEVEDFPSDSDHLTKIRHETLGGFSFGSLDPIDELHNFIGEPVELFNNVNRELTLVSSREYPITAHWALYCENYLEGFHIPYVHADLNAIVDYGTYQTETFRYSILQTGFAENGDVIARYLFVFPNLMFNFYEWGISVNVVRPISPSESVIEFHTYAIPGDERIERADAELNSVEIEDEAIVESVQKGIRSRFYKHGRYSPTREQGTHHFHRLIGGFMF